MEEKIRRVYVPMTETAFYILLCFRNEEQHGYGITQKIKEMTNDEIIIGPGTMYGTLSKMEKDGLIVASKEENKRKFYRITDTGTIVLNLEIKRIARLYKNSLEGQQ